MNCLHCGIELTKENWCKSNRERKNPFHICNKCNYEKYTKPYAQKHKEELRNYIRDYQRKFVLSQGKKKIYLKIPKRPYPKDNKCELCGHIYELKLSYHHWNNTKPQIGIWICNRPCHDIVEFFDKGLLEEFLNKYSELRKSLS